MKLFFLFSSSFCPQIKDDDVTEVQTAAAEDNVITAGSNEEAAAMAEDPDDGKHIFPGDYTFPCKTDSEVWEPH